VIIHESQAKLLQVVAALHSLGRLAHSLHRRQQQADEDPDDGNHHQQLDQSERSPAADHRYLPCLFFNRVKVQRRLLKATTIGQARFPGGSSKANSGE
jgi:hypothetical protein